MQSLSFDNARKAMVESQIRANKVIDDAVIDAFSSIPREHFVPKTMRDIAYIDEDLSLSGGRYVIEPMVMARLIQAADLKPSSSVLVVGTGSGYGAAILSKIVSSVIAIDSRAAMVQKAEQNLENLEIGNVAVIQAKLQDGYLEESPYDAIFIEGAIECVPENLVTQLGPKGVIAAVWRPAGSHIGSASLWSQNAGDVTRRDLFNAQVPVLDEFKAKPSFVF